MNGVSFARGSRYHVSPLDLAILGDTGFPIAWNGAAFAAAGATIAAAVPFATPVPEPSVHALMLVGLLALAWVRKRACA